MGYTIWMKMHQLSLKNYVCSELDATVVRRDLINCITSTGELTKTEMAMASDPPAIQSELLCLLWLLQAGAPVCSYR